MGTTVILVAIAATGVLLATNLSFVRLYEMIERLLRTRFAFVGTIPEKFRNWQQARQDQARIKKETKAAIKAEREASRATLRQTQNLSAAERVADFMKEPIAPGPSPSPIKRVETSTPIGEPRASIAAAASAGVGTQPIPIVTGRSTKRSVIPPTSSDEDEGLEEMVKGASVLRTRVVEAPTPTKLPFDAN